jgi:hypothetical protein
VPIGVVALTGEAGDIVLTHPWVLHCRGTNRATTPRFMQGHDVTLGMIPERRRS